MKTQIVTNPTNVLKNIVTRLFLASFLVLFFVSGKAQEKEPTPVTVRYLGAFNNQPVFGIEFTNPDEEVLYVALKDTNGEVIYSEKFKGKKFSKKFQLNTAGDDNLSITLTSKKTRKTEVFAINRNTRVVEDVVVTRMH